MNYIGRRWPAMVFVGMLLLAGNLAWAKGALYRYQNDKGITVIEDRMPPEYVAKGYEVIRHDGSLIRRVPRQLTEEELLTQNSEEAKAHFREQEQERMRAWDESLLLRYSSIIDIEAAQKRSVRNLQIRISILKSNLQSVKSQIERQQQKAADIERQGRTVPDSLLENIRSLRREIEDMEEAVSQRREEIKGVEAGFQRDMARFTILQDRVKLRR